MRTDHQQLEGVWVEDAVGEQRELAAHEESVHLNAHQIADLWLAEVRIADDRTYGIIESGFLLGMQFLDGSRERRRTGFPGTVHLYGYSAGDYCAAVHDAGAPE